MQPRNVRSFPGGGTLQVRRSSLVCYLGIFINNKFNWEPHVKIMAARAQSSFRGLLLGNLVCGIDFHNWCLVFHAITLPVLLYGLLVWSHKAPKSLIRILQVAQNVAVHKISSTFCTTPVEPLHNMLAIPPIKHTIAKYRAAFTICLSKLPPTALLRTLPSHDPSTFYLPPDPIPTPLTSLLPTSFPVFCTPTGLTWSHSRVFTTLTAPATLTRTATIINLANNTPADHNAIHIYPIPHPNHFVIAFLTFSNGMCIEQGFRASHDRTLATAEAAIAGILSLGPHPGHHILIFVPNRNLHRPLLSLSKHKYLPQATLFTGALGMQCFLHPDITISIHPLAVKLNRKPTRADPRIFPCNWPGPRGKDFNLAELRMEAQLHHIPDALPNPLLKTLPFCLWKADQDNCVDPPRCKWTGGVIPVPESSLPSNLVIGSLSLGQRRAMCAALQVFFQHCFCGAYLQRMCPTSGDTITCPCTYLQTPILMTELDCDGNPWPKADATQDRSRGRMSIARPYATPRSLVSIANRGASFEALMAEQHANPCRTPSRSPPPAGGSARPLAARYGGPRCVQRRMAHPQQQETQVIHSASHILSDCPLVSIFRSCILKDYSFHYLFWTVKGTKALATFLVCSNSLLRPLPPHPDPP